MIAQELRIGNWVQLFDTIGYYKLHLVCKTVIQVESDIIGGETFKLENVHPIPLTPEILEKAGFEHVDGWDDSWWYFDTVGVNLHLGKLYYNDLSKHVELKSLHHLQNIVHALTGQELTIKL